MTALAYFERYQQLTSIEQKKNTLIEELIQRVTELEGAYQQEQLDHDREKRFNRDVQIHEMELMEQLSRTKAIMSREPFIVVLLDGDGVIFLNEFLQRGEQGGRAAARKLWSAVETYVSTKFPSIVSPKIIAKMYVNMKGLSDVCVRGGIAPEPSVLEDFARGFNSSLPLFDLVDVGTGEDTAHEKIREAFKLHLYNCHCHQIFIGCSDKSSYTQILEETLTDMDLLGRVSLIEGIPFGKDLNSLKSTCRSTKFPDLFRETKITPVWAPWKAPVATNSRPLLTPSPIHHVTPLSRTSTNTTSTSNSATPSLASTNTPSPEEFQVVRSKSSFASRSKTVERNKYGQRVDRLDFKSIPREELSPAWPHAVTGWIVTIQNAYMDTAVPKVSREKKTAIGPKVVDLTPQPMALIPILSK